MSCSGTRACVITEKDGDKIYGTVVLVLQKTLIECLIYNYLTKNLIECHHAIDGVYLLSLCLLGWTLVVLITWHANSEEA